MHIKHLDYCNAEKKLHAALAIDLGRAGLVFASNLPWAVHQLAMETVINTDDQAG